jgi:thiamine pyrophosphokinase
MRALVLSNGALSESDEIAKRVLRWGPEIVIAANGGSLHAAALGLSPDVIVGDLDSLNADARGRFSGAIIEQHPTSKDETDLELALLTAVRRGAAHVVIVGALGGRLDMSLANVLLLMHSGLGAARVEIWHGRQTAWLIRPPGGEAAGAPGDTLSLIALGGDAHGVTTRGLAYALEDETLVFGPARGVSNVMQGTRARITLRSGLLLAVHTTGHA